jgi:hypothetical protein
MCLPSSATFTTCAGRSKAARILRLPELLTTTAPEEEEAPPEAAVLVW